MITAVAKHVITAAKYEEDEQTFYEWSCSCNDGDADLTTALAANEGAIEHFEGTAPSEASILLIPKGQ